jgi:hypothetical protein
MQGSTFGVHVFGTSDSIGESVEQFAWLGAALRTSPYQSGVAYCSPYISDIRACGTGAHNFVDALDSSVACTISFAIKERDYKSITSNGQCWHNLFHNPVVVQGYPIPRRLEPDSGLEIPLNIMAELARARRVDIFDKQLFIKGFATMLVPTKMTKDLLIWHLLYTESGGRMSYLDNTVPHAKDVGMNDVAVRRHILGWCSDAKHYAGK